MATAKNYYTATATTSEANFAAASDTFFAGSILASGPAVGTEVEFKVYEKVNPAASAVVVKTLVLKGPGVFPLNLGVCLKDGWYVSHKKLSGADATVAISLCGATP